MPRFVTSAKLLNAEKRRIPSKHYVYVIEVTWSDGSTLKIFRRYSVFFALHTKLLDTFPQYAGNPKTGEGRLIPFLPGKKLFGRSSTHYVAEARAPLLSEYLTKLIACPDPLSKSRDLIGFFEPTDADLSPEKEDTGTKKAEEVSVGDVLLLDQYRVIADYKKQNRQELSVKADQIVEVIEKNENGWWFVQLEDGCEKGFVPGTFLESLDDNEPEETQSVIPPGGEEYIAIKTYKAQQADEISFEKNAVLKVMSKNLDGWWVCQYMGKSGQAPGSYLKKLVQKEVSGVLNLSELAEKKEKPKKKATEAVEPPIRRMSIPQRPKGPKGPVAKKRETMYMAVEAFDKTDPSGVTFPVGANLKVLEKAETGWWYVAFGKEEGWAPADFLEPIDEGDFQEPGMKEQERKSLPKPNAVPSIPGRPVALPKAKPTSSTSTPAVPGRPQGPKKTEIGGPMGATGLAAALEARLGNNNTAKSNAGPPRPPVANSKPAPAAVPQAFGSIAARAAALSGKGPLAGAPTGEKPVGGPQRPPAVPRPPVAGAKPKPAPAKPPVPVAKPKAAVPVIPKKPAVPGKPKVTPKPKPVVGAKPGAAASKGQSCKATSDFSATSSVEISVKSGEVLSLLEKNGEWWYVCNHSGGEGWAPADVLTENTSGSPSKAASSAGGVKYKVLEEYTAASADQLSVKEGQILTMVELSDTGWWWMKAADGSEGWAPSDFMEKL
eukprot:m.20433 g.20433  ORF g.20433 m.20433 type:complete len:719 (+) comp6846_c0_seq1:259-2415(+)